MGNKWYEWFLPTFKINIFNHGYFYVNPSIVMKTNFDKEKKTKSVNISANTNNELYQNKFSTKNKNKKDNGYFELNEIKTERLENLNEN